MPATSAFTVTVNGNAVSVTNVSLSGAVATLTINPAVAYGDTVSVSYTRPLSNKLRDAAANNVANFSTSVTNNTADVAAPTTVVQFPSSSGAYNASGWATNSCSGSPGGGKICGTVSDAGSGVQKVQLSIRDGSANYYDGTGFTSASEVFLNASGTAKSS